MAMAAAKDAKKRAAAAPRPRLVPSLGELQERFQAAVMAGDDAVLDLIPDNSRTTRTVLLGVYRHAYVSRLVDIVGNDHPILARYLGDEVFGAMARGYVREHPSRNSNARWFSHGLPEFLSSSPVLGSRREVAEIARLERALNDAFDAADAAVLDLARLSAYPPERWGELCLVPHPSAARLDLETNAYAIWRALKEDGEPPAAAELADRERLIVWRNGTMPTVRPLGAEEAMMWDEAAKGVPFSALCELVAIFDAADTAALRAAGYLQTWIGAGMLSAAKLARRRRRRQI